VPQENGGPPVEIPAITCIQKLETVDTKNETLCLAKPGEQKSMTGETTLTHLQNYVTYTATSFTDKTFEKINNFVTSPINVEQFHCADIILFSIFAQ
jgi:hypothetical protein